MKAIILNSGQGTRLGSLTANTHKSLLKLKDGETILGRQIRLLHDAGLNDFVVTVGPHEEQMRHEISRYECRYSDISVEIVKNPLYASTNYIYSIWLARELLHDDIVLLHGDLLFDCEYAKVLINNNYSDVGSTNSSIPLPNKDFKALIVKGRLRKVSVDFFGLDAVAFQPFYKLSRETVHAWLTVIEAYVKAGQTSCYAEDALNEILGELDIRPVSYASHILDEVDTPADYARVTAEIASFENCNQTIITHNSLAPSNTYNSLETLEKVFVIHGNSFYSNKHYNEVFSCLNSPVSFTEFSPNPTIEAAQDAFETFMNAGCQSILAIGGGSAIDVSKLVVAQALGLIGENSKQKMNDIRFIAIPTTAGTGSESTHFAAYYQNGIKQSFASNRVLPQIVILDSRFIASLPHNHKVASFFDALCQGIESLWSVQSNPVSRCYARESLRILRQCYEPYFSTDQTEVCMHDVLLGANLAGRAINISKTTAPHAMSYGLTANYRIPHGYAVALCMMPLWQELMLHTSYAPYDDGRSIGSALDEIANALGFADSANAIAWFKQALSNVEMPVKAMFKANQIQSTIIQSEQLVSTINSERLSNHPVTLSSDELKSIYRAILDKQKEY